MTNADTPPIPDEFSQITVQWISAVLERNGIQPPSAVSVSPIGTGQMAHSVRVGLQYGKPVDSGLASVVVKYASSDPTSRGAGAGGAYLREVQFYRQLADDLPVATPSCYWADIDDDGSAFVLVLEDLHPAIQGDQIAGASEDHIAAAAHNIAGLHAPRWNDPSLFGLEWLTAPIDQTEARAAELAGLVGMFTPGFLDRYRARMDDRSISLLSWFVDHVEQWLVDGSTFSLLHADHRLDNLLFGGADATRPVTVVDWQTLGVRNPLGDLAYLIGTGLDPVVRRDREQAIVQHYHDRLVALGVSDYPFSECFEDYRKQTPHILLLTVLGSMLSGRTDRGDDMFMAMLQRGTQQMFDLDVR